jgi:hypothetical protein
VWVVVYAPGEKCCSGWFNEGSYTPGIFAAVDKHEMVEPGKKQVLQ